MNTTQRVSENHVLENGVLRMQMTQFLEGVVLINDFITVLSTEDTELMRQFLKSQLPKDLVDVEL